MSENLVHASLYQVTRKAPGLMEKLGGITGHRAGTNDQDMDKDREGSPAAMMVMGQYLAADCAPVSACVRGPGYAVDDWNAERTPRCRSQLRKPMVGVRRHSPAASGTWRHLLRGVRLARRSASPLRSLQNREMRLGFSASGAKLHLTSSLASCLGGNA